MKPQPILDDAEVIEAPLDSKSKVEAEGARAVRREVKARRPVKLSKLATYVANRAARPA